MEIDEGIGARIEQIRLHFELSRKDFADRLGQQDQNIYRYERDKRTPGPDFFVALLQEFRINLNWLFTGQGEMRIVPLTESGLLLAELRELEAQAQRQRAEHQELGMWENAAIHIVENALKFFEGHILKLEDQLKPLIDEVASTRQGLDHVRQLLEADRQIIAKYRPGQSMEP